MIKAGFCFCPTCAAVYTDAFYKSARHAVGVRLKHSVLSGKCTVEKVLPQRSNEKVTLLSCHPKQHDGLPERIQVRIETKDDAPLIVDMYRHCPNCAKNGRNTKAFKDSGKYNTYVIVVVGDRDTGKSAWLDAVGYPGNFSAVNSERYPDALRFVNPVSPMEATKATEAEFGRGKSKFFYIINRADNRVKAQVLLLDMAGELFRSAPDDLWHLLCGSEGYPGADAFIFFESLAPRPMTRTIENTCGAANIYTECVSRGAFDRKPAAHVRTHLDLLIQRRKFPTVRDSGDHVDVPLMSAATFAQKTSYRLDKLVPRIALEHSIARQLQPPAMLLLDQPGSCTQGFLVQSCRTVSDPKQPNLILEDRSQSINVMDPLLWTLNKLKIFSLVEAG